MKIKSIYMVRVTGGSYHWRVGTKLFRRDQEFEAEQHANKLSVRDKIIRKLKDITTEPVEIVLGNQLREQS